MPVREPVVAGQFYAASPDQCRVEVESYLSQARSIADIEETRSWTRLFGGIVPHAGWICSGAVAAEVIKMLAEVEAVDSFVIFGAAHRPSTPRASVFGAGSWATPMGEIAIDEELADAVVHSGNDVQSDSQTHQFEHSIEVQVPFIQYLKPHARILPVVVPPTSTSQQVGQLVAREAQQLQRETVFIGSTDLTHYGPRYGFAPQGVGEEGLDWAKQVNDRRILDLILQLKADQVVDEARSNQNACGSGAIAAAVGACVEAGANAGTLLQHTTSNEVLADRLGPSSDAVGYAGILFGQKAT
jgi:hypothetical protein